MLRLFLPFTALVMASAPAAAATYSSRPAAPAHESKIAARDILWACGPESCAGSTRYSRPLVLCQGLAKKVGRLESFAVDGRALELSELERCNASARSNPDKALATGR